MPRAIPETRIHMSEQSSAILITIDGPAGAGKTTVSKMLADRLGYRYIDTGALYRGVAFEAKRAGAGVVMTVKGRSVALGTRGAGANASAI